jgi:hypothetical protein
MNEANKELPDLIWSCFINWLNTLEKVGDFEITKEQKLVGTTRLEKS